LDFKKDNGQPSRWIVILGTNGVGKTTILQSLAGLCAKPDSIVEKKNPDIHTPMAGCAMADINWFSWHEACHRSDSLEPQTISAEIAIGCTLDNIGSISNHPVECEFVKQEEGRVQISSTMAPLEMGAGLIAYGYGASRPMAPSGRARPTKQGFDKIETLMSESGSLANAEEWLLELDHASKIDGDNQQKFKEQIETVKCLLLKVLPGVSDLRVAVTKADSARPPVRTEFLTVYGWVTLNGLSLGYKSMIGWVCDLTKKLFERYPHSENPLAEPAIVLVDEIDLHLHPQWQRNVIDFLTERFSNTQFIVTAHSPLVLHSGTDAKIILIEDVNGHIRANHELSSVKNWRLDQIVTSDLFKIPSAHPPQIATAILERSKILSKAKLSSDDELEISRLNQIIHSIPSGSSDIERRAEELLQRALTKFDISDDPNQ
jgi:predicted ATP-binding protein involved in virulence